MIYEEINSYREFISIHLNDYLEAQGLPPFTSFEESPMEVDKQDLSVAIYLANADQGTANWNGMEIECEWYLVYSLNNNADKKEIEANIKQYSAVFDFLREHTFGEASIIEASGVFRMDQGEPLNGGVFLIKSRINTSMDYGW